MSYSVQIAADSKHNLIVAYDVIKNLADQGNLYEMSKKAKEIFDKEKLSRKGD